MIPSLSDFCPRKPRRGKFRRELWESGTGDWITGRWCRFIFSTSMIPITGWCASGCRGCLFRNTMNWGSAYRRQQKFLGRNTVVIGSGDLSHKLKEDGPYGFQKEGPEYDERIMDVMGRAAFGELFDFPEDFCDRAAECGHRSFVIMAGTLDRRAVKAERRLQGPRAHSEWGTASVSMKPGRKRREGISCGSMRKKV